MLIAKKMKIFITKIPFLNTITNVKETFRPLLWLNTVLGLFSEDLSTDKLRIHISLIYSICLYIFYEILHWFSPNESDKILTTPVTALAYKIIQEIYSIFFLISAVYSYFNAKASLRNTYIDPSL